MPSSESLVFFSPSSQNSDAELLLSIHGSSDPPLSASLRRRHPRPRPGPAFLQTFMSMPDVCPVQLRPDSRPQPPTSPPSLAAARPSLDDASLASQQCGEACLRPGPCPRYRRPQLIRPPIIGRAPPAYRRTDVCQRTMCAFRLGACGAVPICVGDSGARLPASGGDYGGARGAVAHARMVGKYRASACCCACVCRGAATVLLVCPDRSENGHGAPAPAASAVTVGPTLTPTPSPSPGSRLDHPRQDRDDSGDR
ncbi:hypothetical protein C8Q77DRAFT_326663 [Trametes polyzona]|nr:hypothetical protein C8Q77DRAFT_326663 [Trametes polyzona]